METGVCEVFENVAGSGSFHTGPCIILAVFTGETDEINDPGFGLYNGLDNSGNKYIPHNMLNASQLGMNGATFGFRAYFPKGCYCDITDQNLTVAVWGIKL